MTQFRRRVQASATEAGVQKAPRLAPLGLGLVVIAILACPAWWVSEFFLSSGTFAEKLSLVAGIMFGLGVGVSSRAALDRVFVRRFWTGAVAVLEAAICGTLFCLFLASTCSHMSTMWDMVGFAIIFVTPLALIALILFAPREDLSTRTSA